MLHPEDASCVPTASAFKGGAAIKLQQWGIDMRNFINSYLRDESGAAAAEYALILGIIGTAIAGSSILFGDAIGGVMSRAAGKMGAILP